jgi:multicomponent Na+:H+ antiporter subunit E
MLPVRLPPGWPSVVLADAVSLLPGTLAVRLDTRQACLELHVLDLGTDVATDVAALEQRVARLFGIEPPPR